MELAGHLWRAAEAVLPASPAAIVPIWRRRQMPRVVHEAAIRVSPTPQALPRYPPIWRRRLCRPGCPSLPCLCTANRLYEKVKALLAGQPNCRFLLFDFRIVVGIDSSATPLHPDQGCGRREGGSAGASQSYTRTTADVPRHSSPPPGTFGLGSFTC